MISSGRLSDRKLTRMVEDGYCDVKCPYFRVKETGKPVDDMTCFHDGKDIVYHDGYLAHCEYKTTLK